MSIGFKTIQEFKQDLIEWLKLLNEDRKNGKRLPKPKSLSKDTRTVLIDGKKICACCKEAFDYNIINFTKDSRRKYGLGSYCRKCSRLLDKIKKCKRKENVSKRYNLCS